MVSHLSGTPTSFAFITRFNPVKSTRRVRASFWKEREICCGRPTRQATRTSASFATASTSTTTRSICCSFPALDSTG
jgi:hypothetical protein